MASKCNVDVFGEHILTCSICYELFKKPKVLPCLHSFCQECIERHHEIYKLCNGGKLCCPTCRAIIPLPLNGVEGFRSDAIILKTKQIMKTLPNIHWKDADNMSSSLVIPDEGDHVDEGDQDSSDDEMPSRKRRYTKPGDVTALLNASTDASGWSQSQKSMVQDIPDPPEVSTKRATLRKEQNAVQSAIAKMRSKMLELYHIENYVTKMVENEINEKTESIEKQGKKAIKKVKVQVQEKHTPTLAMLMKEQDKFYQKIVEAKSVHDIIEEVLERTTAHQVLEVFDHLMQMFKKINPIVRTESVANATLDSLQIPKELIEVVRLEMEQTHKLSAMPTVRDPRKMGVKLIFKVSGYGKEANKFDFPTHATFHPNGDLIVSDKNNCRLQVFDKKGELKQELFNGIIKPRRAKVNRITGNLYVSDEQSESVKVFSPSGELISRIGETYFLCTAGMDFDSQGNLVMTDPEKNYVSIHDKDSGKLTHKFFFRYMQDRKVPNPYFVAVNEDDQFIISDKRNGRIKVFASNGQLLFRIDKLDCPRGVCVDPYGNILVAEGDKHRVAMYSPYGKFLQYLIDREEHGLNYPLSLDMDKHGRLAVTQCGYLSPHEVMVFQIC